VIASLMVESNQKAWHEMVKQTEDTGADGIELNFGCPHGMSERGMGSAVGQVPDYTCQIVAWVKEVATIPVIVKLTPNVTDITYIARAAVKGGADALSLINTINSIVGVDLTTFEPQPSVAGKSSHGGYCGPAVKPIALHLVSAVAGDPTVQIPVSGIGGISTWRDAAEFIALGAGTLQVCTAVMHYGFRIVEDLIDGLSNWMDERGHRTLADIRGRALPRVTKWENLDLNYHLLAHIDQDKCIKCELCWTACEDGAHQAIRRLPRDNGGPVVEIIDEACVGCNLCAAVCPVQDCITMRQVPNDYPPVTWKEYAAGKGKLAPRSPEFHTANWAPSRK
jgi:dihydropyrimidine dehydrogenase (NAD+) subunit PreA